MCLHAGANATSSALQTNDEQPHPRAQPCPETTCGPGIMSSHCNCHELPPGTAELPQLLQREGSKCMSPRGKGLHWHPPVPAYRSSHRDWGGSWFPSPLRDCSMLNTAERTFSIMGRVPSPGGDSSRLHGTGRIVPAVLMSSFYGKTLVQSFKASPQGHPSKDASASWNNKLVDCCAVPMAPKTRGRQQQNL